MPAATLFSGKSSPLASKLALSSLSNHLMSSPASRAAFVKDPSGYVAQQWGAKPSVEEEQFLKALGSEIADGLCCQGCGCSPANPGELVSNPIFQK